MLFNDNEINSKIENLTNAVSSLAMQVSSLKKELETFKTDFNSVIADTEELNKMERQNAESLQKMMNYDPFNFNGVNSNE